MTREQMKQYQRKRRKMIKEGTWGERFQQYIIYDLEDNYIYGGSLEEICKYTNKTRKSMHEALSNLKHRRIQFVYANGNKCKIIKLEK